MSETIWNISYLCDILLALFYFRRRELKNAPAPRRALGLLCLLATYVLYPSGLFPMLSNSFTRYAVRILLTSGYLLLCRQINAATAVYAAAYWSTMHLLVHNLFFAPSTYPIFTGTFPLTSNPAANVVLCTLLISLVTAIACVLLDRFTPLLNMSPIDPGRVLSLVLIIIIGVYAKELALPLRGMDDAVLSQLSVCYLFLMLALLLLMLFIEYNRRQQREKAAVELQNQAVNALLKSIEDQRENAENVRRLRHDLKNHMLTVRLLLEQDGPAAALDYLRQFLTEAAPPAASYSTGNDLLDGLLLDKLGHAASEGIRTEVSLDFSACRFLPHFDLCVIWSNILDNAIEACCRVPNREDRFILLSGGESAGCQVLRLANSSLTTPQLIDGLPPTIKADPFAHGFGLRNVERTLRKYGGELSISTDTPGRFALTILIPLPENE